MKFYFLVTLLVLFSACKTYSETEKDTFDSKIQKFTHNSPLKYKKSESGLYYFIEEIGNGELIKPTDVVKFTYVGKLLNGKPFDIQHKKRPIEYKVSKLIMGWQEAMLYLKKGGKIKLVVPPQLAYGDYELDDIPKNSILVFNIEVIEVN